MMGFVMEEKMRRVTVGLVLPMSMLAGCYISDPGVDGSAFADEMEGAGADMATAARPDMRSPIPANHMSSPDMRAAVMMPDMKTGAQDMPPPAVDMRPSMGVDMAPPEDVDMSSSVPDMGMMVDMGAPMMSCGDGMIEAPETCDGDCPTSCDDGDACTQDTLVGDASMCTAACLHPPVACSMVADGCCPAACTGADDADCAAIDCEVLATWPTEWRTQQDALVAEINRRRTTGGSCAGMSMAPVGALNVDPTLAGIARCHTWDTKIHDDIGYMGPSGQMAFDRVLNSSYPVADLQVYLGSGFTDPASFLNTTINDAAKCSKLHGANFVDVGVGYARDNSTMTKRFWSIFMAQPR